MLMFDRLSTLYLRRENKHECIGFDNSGALALSCAYLSQLLPLSAKAEVYLLLFSTRVRCHWPFLDSWVIIWFSLAAMADKKSRAALLLF